MNKILSDSFRVLFGSETPEIQESVMAELLIGAYDGGKLGDLAGPLLAEVAGNTLVSPEVRMHACALITEVKPEKFSPAHDDPNPDYFERWIHVC